jgi:hypothetical protein
MEGVIVKKTLRKNQINSLWHFTDIRNLPLIYELQGLRSKQYITDNEKTLADAGKEVYPGGDDLSHELDRKNGNWDKISLSFIPNTPMFYNKKVQSHFVLIEIDLNILDAQTTFTDTNATNSEHSRDIGVNGLDLIDFNAIQAELYSDLWQHSAQAEVLVPNFIPEKVFKNIHFMSYASLEMGEYLLPEWGNKFCNAPQIFNDFSKNFNKMQCVESVRLTFEQVNNDNCFDNFAELETIIPGKPFTIIVSFICAVADVIIRIKDKNENILQTITDESQQFSFYITWSSGKGTNSSTPNNNNIEKNIFDFNELIIEVLINEVIYYKRKFVS